MRLMAYRNLNRKGVVWSLKSLRTGLVIGYSKNIVFKDVELYVSQAGRLRAVKEQKRNVHAGVRGLRTSIKKDLNNNLKWVKVTYNPFKHESFVKMNGEQIFKAKYAKLTSQGLFIVE